MTCGLLLLIYILHDPVICTMLPEFLGFWFYLKWYFCYEQYQMARKAAMSCREQFRYAEDAAVAGSAALCQAPGGQTGFEMWVAHATSVAAA